MSLGIALDAPFYTGVGAEADPRFDVVLGGHGYMIDLEQIEQFGRQSVTMIRQQADNADRPAEASLNPDGLWRRAQDSWHHGAGQEWFDKPESLPTRFHESKGVDPWTKYGLTLLPDTDLIDAATESNLHLAVAAGRLYMASGQNVRVTGEGNTTFGDCTGEPAAQVTALTSDGATVYAAFGPRGIYTATGTVFAQFATGNTDLLRYCKGRLIAVDGAAVHNPTEAGALDDDSHLFTHPTATWRWVDACPGPGHIYLAGRAGDKSAVYKTEVRPDGTALDIPVVAAELPDGELVHSVTGYLWYVVIGTSKGVRFAVPDNDGYLNVGALIETGSPVRCGEGQDRFIWYGLTNFDGTSTGLGRLDLKTFTGDLTPAFASDLMAADQGQVVSVATYLDRRVFTVATGGCYIQADDTVTSGYVTTGRITYGLPDTKTAADIDVRHDPLPAGASVALAVSIDDGETRAIGTSQTDGTAASADDTFVLNQARGTHFDITATLTGDVTLRRVTLHADPSSERTTIFQVPILFADSVGQGPVPRPMDADAEMQYLLGLLDTRQVFDYVEGGRTHRTVMHDYTWRPTQRSARRPLWDGTFIARLKEL